MTIFLLLVFVLLILVLAGVYLAVRIDTKMKLWLEEIINAKTS